MIKQLKNNLSSNYLHMKEIILSPKFEWNYYESSTPENEIKGNHTNVSFYSHNVLIRPEAYERYITNNSKHIELITNVLDEIIDYNNLYLGYFYLRINVNSVHPDEGIQLSMPHIDHGFPHTNILVYLTSSGGDTIVEDESYSPREDDVIIFEGQHYMERPKKSRRVVLVATIFDMYKFGK